MSNNEELKKLLVYKYGDAGLPPGSLRMHTRVVMHPNLCSDNTAV